MDIATLCGNDFFPANAMLFYTNEEVVGDGSLVTSHSDEEREEEEEEEVCLALSSEENVFEAGTRAVPEGNNLEGNSYSPLSRANNYCNGKDEDTIIVVTEDYLNQELSTPSSSSTSSHIDSTESAGASPQQVMVYLEPIPEEQSQTVFTYNESSDLHHGEEEGDDLYLSSIPIEVDEQTASLTVPISSKDLKQLLNPDNKSGCFLSESLFSNDIQERILMEDSHRSSELTDPHIPIEKFSEKMQLELITDINRSSSEQDYTGIKNNGSEDNFKEVSNCNNKCDLSQSYNNFKSGDGASCNTSSKDFRCTRKVRFNLTCNQEKRAKRKTKPLSSHVRNSLLTKRSSSFKRKSKKNMTCCGLGQNADNMGTSNYNVVEATVNNVPKRTSCTPTKLQCPKEDGGFLNVPKVDDDIFTDVEKFTFSSFDNYNFPEVIFEPDESHDNLLRDDCLNYDTADLLPKGNKSIGDVHISEETAFKDDDFAKISESYELLSFEMGSRSEVEKLSVQNVEVSPVKIVGKLPVQNVEVSPVKIVGKLPKQNVEVSPVKIVGKLPVQNVEVSPVKIVGKLPVQNMEVSPVKIVGKLSVQNVEVSPVKIVGKLPVQNLEVSAAKIDNIPERSLEPVSEVVEPDFEGFEYSAKNSLDSSALVHKRVVIMKALNAQENRQEWSEFSSAESDYSNEENVSPESSVGLCPDLQVPDVSTSGSLEDGREKKKVLTKSKKENLSVGEENDKLLHLKGYQQIRSSFSDHVIERIKESSKKERSRTKVLDEALPLKAMRKKSRSQFKKKLRAKEKKIFKQKCQTWNKLFSKANKNREDTIQVSSPDHNYCKTPEKRKETGDSDDGKNLDKIKTCNKYSGLSPDKGESESSINGVAKREASAEGKICNDVGISNDLTNEPKIYNKLPEYCMSNIICQKSEEKQAQQVNAEMDLPVKIKEEPKDIDDSPLLSVQNKNERIVNEGFKNDASIHIKQEPVNSEPKKKDIEIDHIKQELVELEPDKKDNNILYNRLPDYVTDIGNVKPKIDLPGVVFEKVMPQENNQDEQSEGCKKKKKLNLFEYRMRKMNSAESSRCCSPNVSLNTPEGKISSFNSQVGCSDWSALHKSTEDKEEGEIKDESGYLSNISLKKNECPKIRDNTLERQSPNKRNNTSTRCTNGERESRPSRQKRKQRPNNIGKKPVVIEIDLEAEEEEKKREEKIKAKLGFISNLKMPATSLGHSLLYSTKNSPETKNSSKHLSSNSSSRLSPKKRQYNWSSSSRSRSRSQSSKESSHRKRSKGRSKRTSNHRKSRRRLSRSRSRSESLTSLSSLSSSGVSSRSRSRSTTKSKSKSYSKYKSHRSRSRSRSRSRRRRHKHKRSSRSNGYSRYRSRSRSPLRNWGTSRYTPAPAYGYSAYAPGYYGGPGYNGYDYVEPQRSYDPGRCENERLVIHVGGLINGTTKEELRSEFERFGEIYDCSVHFRDIGDNYGFVNFRTKEAAYAAYEYGASNHHLPYKISFGNRRNFCKTGYSDLDAQNEDGKYYNSANDMDYDTLFQTHRLQRQ